MLYLQEDYYFRDQKDFPFRKAVLVTAQAVGVWCNFYRAKLLVPKKGVKEKTREGALPEEKSTRDGFIAELVSWIFENSLFEGTFSLHLDTAPIAGTRGPKKFDDSDGHCCWTLDLTSDEFTRVQDSWRAHELPDDLFYPAGAEIRVPLPLGPISRLLIRFGFTTTNERIYSPKRWAMKNTSKLTPD